MSANFHPTHLPVGRWLASVLLVGFFLTSIAAAQVEPAPDAPVANPPTTEPAAAGGPADVPEPGTPAPNQIPPAAQAADAPQAGGTPPTTQQAQDTAQANATTRPANDNGPRGATTQPGGGIMLNFRDARIDAVLDELSAAAGFIVVKTVTPQGRVSLVSKQPVSPEEAIALLNTVLRDAGYAAIQQERTLKIVNRDAAKKLNIPVRTGADPTKIAQTDELITQVIPLRFADATQLRQDLQPMINTDADFTANASSNALVLTDTSANVRRIVQIVNALDTHLADAAEVKVFVLKYATASTAAKLINDVFGTQDQFAGPSARTGTSDQGGGRGGPGGGGPGDFFRRMAQSQQQQGRQIKVNAAADDRTNTIIVSGPADTLVVVARVISELDSNPEPEETVFVFRLRNARAANVEAVMNLLINGISSGTRSNPDNAQTLAANRGLTSTNSRTTGTGGTRTTGTSGARTTSTGGLFGTTGQRTTGTTGTQRTGFGGAAVSAGARQAASDLAGQATFIGDYDTNSILVRTSPKNVDRVRALLEELDRPVAQVLIKVLIAEVTHTSGDDIGAEFSILNLRPSGLGVRTGTNFNLAGQPNGLVVQLLEEHLSVTIKALQKDGKLDVLSRPYILASDNQLASITVGQEVPFITNTRITDQGQVINTIEYGDVGILLDVIPHINPEGLVILDVAPVISQLTAQTVPISDTVGAPIIAKRSAQSRVAVQNGHTVVIGGLMEDRYTSSVDKVPLLGDIPLLGEVFKRRRMDKSKTELLIFLTPHVAADPRQLGPMTQDEVDSTRLVPGAVAPGLAADRMKNLDRGATTQPAGITIPTPRPGQ